MVRCLFEVWRLFNSSCTWCGAYLIQVAHGAVLIRGVALIDFKLHMVRCLFRVRRLFNSSCTWCGAYLIQVAHGAVLIRGAALI